MSNNGIVRRGRPKVRQTVKSIGLRVEKADSDRWDMIASLFPNMSKNALLEQAIHDGLDVRMRRMEREIHPTSLADACKLATQFGWHITEDGELRSPGRKRWQPEDDQADEMSFLFAGYRIPLATFIGYQKFGIDALTRGVRHVNGNSKDNWPDNIELHA